jgi:hypothetical protein
LSTSTATHPLPLLLALPLLLPLVLVLPRLLQLRLLRLLLSLAPRQSRRRCPNCRT